MTTDAAILAGLNDYSALSLTLWGEARNQPIEGVIGVGWVIKHRLAQFARFRAVEPTYKSVVLAPAQFSCWTQGPDVNHAKLMALAEQLVNGRVPTDDAAWLECAWVATGIIEHRIRDQVYGAAYYLTRELYDSRPPLWATRLDAVRTLGDHVFLRDPPSKVLTV